MDVSQLNSIATTGSSAASTVASSLSTRRAVQSSTNASGATSTTSSSSNAAGSSSDITANDFLTLLVSELKNQDPTQPTDGSQFLTQLATFSQLEQLIGIRQDLDTAKSSTTTTPQTTN